MGIIAIVLVIASRACEPRSWLRYLSWIILAAVGVQAVLGLQPVPQAPTVRIMHAFSAELLLPMGMVLAVCSSGAWQGQRERVECAPSLWFLAKITPIVVLGQVVLGTLFRHGALDVGPHIIGAFVVAFLILGLALPLINRPDHQSLHLPAKAFLTIAFLQVFLGLALFSMQGMEIDPAVMILVAMIHLAVGALTLAAAVMLTLLIRQRVTAPERAARVAKKNG